MGRRLTVVPPESKAKSSKRKPATIKAAAARSEKTLLVAMRDRVAAEIDKGPPSHTLAPLMRQLREIDKELRTLKIKEDGDDIDAAAATSDEAWSASS